ncbi:MAG: tetratricopeptide repeat protein [Candidatus Eisenbacteria bacterium]|nr:tetratricopeptide repeat protein [Candidatus Eisenbacteria bacterium]
MTWRDDQRYAVRELGHLLLSEGRADLARVLFEGLVAVDPDDAWSRIALAASYRLEKRYVEASGELDEALKREPQSIEAALSLGEVALLDGRAQEAKGVAAMVEYMARSQTLSEPLKLRVRRLARACSGR